MQKVKWACPPILIINLCKYESRQLEIGDL